MSRAQALKTLAAGTAAFSLGAAVSGKDPASHKITLPDNIEPLQLKGNINHSACRWCYNSIELDDLCRAAKDMGLKSIELLWPEEYPVAAKHGLTCAISFGSKLGIVNGFNDPNNHEQLLKDFKEIIPKAADAGLTQVICFSGNRSEAIDDETGMENCAVGLDPVVKFAAQYDIVISMELLNSKVNHPNYMCDHTPWGVALAEKVGADNLKLLYDIYHMQIMEGDVIATIRKYHEYISHYHTGGVPGRHEINDTQELYYPAIMKAILETGYKGFVGQEFVPTWDDPLAALKEGVTICDV